MIHRDECYRIVGACFEVYNDKGCGFLEPAYQECLAIELRHQKIPFIAEPVLTLSYRNVPLEHTYRPDFVCFGKIIVEVKTTSSLRNGHEAQLLNYLSAAGFELGPLINFGHHPKLKYKRLVQTQKQPAARDAANLS